MSPEIKYYPLTHPQKAQWYRHQFFPEIGICNIVASIRLWGVIDYDKLGQAINLFIRKNEGMRLRIVEMDGEPWQYVAEHLDHEWEFLDFSNTGGMDAFHSWVDTQMEVPFQLSDSDLFHYVLYKTGKNEGGILAKTHHIISDAWTMALMGSEVIGLYTLLVSGEPIPEQDWPSYLDYVALEIKNKTSSEYIAARKYWLDRYENIPPVVTLKPSNSPLSSTRASRKSESLKVETTDTIYSFCKQTGFSGFVLFLAGLSIYLNRITEKNDVVIGVPVLLRPTIKEQATIGMFIDWVPVRLQVNEDLRFIEYLAYIRDIWRQAKNHPYPFDLLLQDIRDHHSTSTNLFDVILSYQKARVTIEDDYETQWYFNRHQTESLMINISDRESTGHLTFEIDYKDELFNENEIDRLFGHLMTILEEGISNPEKHLYELNLLTEYEQRQLIDEFAVGDGNRTYVLDAKHRLLPLGYVGDLYVADEGLKNDAFSDTFLSDKIIHFTGQRARRLLDGSLELVEDIEKQDLIDIPVKIAATFTAEPVGDYIKWWGKQFGYNFEMGFTSYNQVFQELLSPDSSLATNEGINVLLVRFEDYIRDDHENDETKESKLETVYCDLLNAISQFGNTVPMIIAIFPLATHLKLSAEIQNKIAELNHRLAKDLEQYRYVYQLDLTHVQDTYLIDDMFDELKDREGHMPFTDEYYAAIGTEIARKIIAIKKQLFKVIVVDCDNTLWNGVCGEVGTLDVKVEGGYRMLQEFLIQKQAEGLILAICSKNNEADVYEVFDQNHSMLLKREHIVSWRVNWQEKSQNIKEIAKELNLGLDSFIFIDDNPLECAKMVEGCPEVLTLQLPETEQDIAIFLQHVWAFDRARVTKEDTERSGMYAAEQKRREVKTEALSLEEFLKRLDIKVSMRMLSEDEIERAAQLTQRTNQFNLSTIRRSEQEIQILMADDRHACYVIEAADRYGDYGIVGLVILRDEVDYVTLDTFLLSCRVLGRTIENATLMGIQRYAEEKGRTQIVVPYVPSKKNGLVMEFIQGQGWKSIGTDEAGTKYMVLVDQVPDAIDFIRFHWNERYQATELQPSIVSSSRPLAALDHVAISMGNPNVTERFSAQLSYDTGKLEKTIHKAYLLPIKHLGGQELLQLPIFESNVVLNNRKYVAPSNEIEQKLTEIWEQVLRTQRVGIDDNFFELGGNSLKATITSARIRRELGINVAVRQIIKNPTVRQLGLFLSSGSAQISAPITMNSLSIDSHHNTEPMDMQVREALLDIPIEEAIGSGILPLVDATALTYIPDGLGNFLSDTINIGNPITYSIICTEIGNIAIQMLPIRGEDVYLESDKLIALAAQACEMANRLGARVVSLTGLIPSATEKGLALETALNGKFPSLSLTTGHTTTCASIALSLRRLLEEAGRDLAEERLGILGLGMVGKAALDLFLGVLPHPRELILCDVFAKKESLEILRQELKTKHGFINPIRIVLTRGSELPDSFYDSTVIFGATNVPDLIDVNRLNSGTIVIDDSAPHCFSTEDAFRRLQNKQDILFTEGGFLESPVPMIKRVALPADLDPTIFDNFRGFLFNPRDITGCVLSSLLSAKIDHLRPVIGETTLDETLAHFRQLETMGFKGGRLHCDDRELDQGDIESFRRKYGNEAFVHITKK